MSKITVTGKMLYSCTHMATVDVKRLTFCLSQLIVLNFSINKAHHQPVPYLVTFQPTHNIFHATL